MSNKPKIGDVCDAQIAGRCMSLNWVSEMDVNVINATIVNRYFHPGEKIFQNLTDFLGLGNGCWAG